MINAKEVLQAQLARGLGLDRYAEIMHVDPSSLSFQRLFNGYYRVRRNEEWRRYYYRLFIMAKKENYNYDQIITSLFTETGNVEASFSSKMLSTINPEKPIWDQYVLQNLGLELTGKTSEERLHHAISLYAEIENWYVTYLSSEEAAESIRVFDLILPEYAWISSTKKIDCLLWNKR